MPGNPPLNELFDMSTGKTICFLGFLWDWTYRTIDQDETETEPGVKTSYRPISRPSLNRSINRQGFTALELLITIAVIVTLVGILTIGLKTVTSNAKSNETKVALGNLQSMIAELEAAAGTNRQPPFLYARGHRRRLCGEPV